MIRAQSRLLSAVGLLVASIAVHPAYLLAQGDALPLTPAQIEELQRRVADADAHPDDGVPWEQVRAELMQRGE